jgi:hypothetical protein
MPPARMADVKRRLREEQPSYREILPEWQKDRRTEGGGWRTER